MKKTNRVFPLLLSIVMLFSLTSFFAVEPFADGNVYEVSTSQGLSDAMGAHMTDASATIRLTADITLSDDYSISSSNKLAATIDGNHHKIYNLKSVFCYVSGGTVKNITFENKTSPTGGAITRNGTATSLFSEICGGTFINVINNIDQTPKTTYGLFAKTCSGTVLFQNCVNNGNVTVSGAYKTGGFVGSSNGNVTFENCENNGNIQGSQVGGFIGVYKNDSENAATYTFTNCVNRGKISASKGTDTQAGGFFGSTEDKVVPASPIAWSFTDCVNYGDIYASADTQKSGAAGLIGWLPNDASGQNYTVSFTNCGNIGCKIQAGTENANAAGFLSYVGLNASEGDVISVNPYNLSVTFVGNKKEEFVGGGGTNFESRNTVKVDSTATRETVSAGIFSNLSYQKKLNDGAATYDYRFVVKLNLPGTSTLDDYQKVGFRIIAVTADGNRMWYRDSATVYSGIMVGDTAVPAGEGAYWVALTLQNCPATKKITYYVQPYFMDAAGEIYYGSQGSSIEKSVK